MLIRDSWLEVRVALQAAIVQIHFSCKLGSDSHPTCNLLALLNEAQSSISSSIKYSVTCICSVTKPKKTPKKEGKTTHETVKIDHNKMLNLTC